MTVSLAISIGEQTVECRVADRVVTIPVGTLSTARSITSDPPAPVELTNAIGLVVDHFDDVDRELPEAHLVDTVLISGHGVAVLADVELGQVATLPVTLARTDLEALFRAIATERAAERRFNPALPDEWVHDILGVCCVMVAIYRHLDLSTAVLER